MKFQVPRGTQDILPERSGAWQAIEARARDVSERYGYAEIRTPIFEATALFLRGVGETTDIVTKEMYTFADRKGRSLTLRPEGTAGVMRALVEHGQLQPGRVQRLWYLGPMFRYDRPQAGRYRQFWQFDVEALGDPGPAVDAEIIELAARFYMEVGLYGVELRLNSIGDPVCRPAYIDALRAYRA